MKLLHPKEIFSKYVFILLVVPMIRVSIRRSLSSPVPNCIHPLGFAPSQVGYSPWGHRVGHDWETSLSLSKIFHHLIHAQHFQPAFLSPMILLQEGRPLSGPETGLLSNTQKWIVWGDTSADKARDFIGKGHLGGEQQGKGTQENCSATWLPVSTSMVMGLASGWSLANHSNSESFLVVQASVSQDGC